MKPLPVIEIFGPTIAGEGHIAGEQTLFIRLGYCDFRCSWCDSMHAVDPDQVRRNAEYLGRDSILDRVRALDPNRKVPWMSLSGGNPAMHASAGELVNGLRGAGYLVNVETQGSLWQDWLRDCASVTVSPKPPSSGMTDRENPEVLARILDLPQALLKVVVFNRADLDWATRIRHTFPEVPFYVSIGTDPGDTRETLLDRYRSILAYTLASDDMRDVTILPQMHVLVWGHGQGV